LTSFLVALLLAIPVPSGPSLATGDSTHAWAGGAGGVYATRNGGRTWTLRSRAPVSGLAASGPHLAWYSSQGILWRTTDGGAHWAHVSAPHLLSFSFLGATDGFGLDRDGIVLRTTDGGRHWRVVHTPRTVVQSECFVSTAVGWLARGGTVWSTRDGGHSWFRSQLLRSRQGGFPIPDLQCRSGSVWVLFHEGAAAGSEGYAVFRSLSGGTSWKPVLAQFVRRGLPRISAYSGPFAATDRFAAVFVGSCSPCGRGTVSVVRTTNSGRTFKRQTFPAALPGPVAFSDRMHGYLVTSSHTRRGIVWRTRDGAASWQRVFSSKRLR
jgi:photosystem II stability/assembly factor-like uncharacterized protein